jgi:hypothetical protein
LLQVLQGTLSEVFQILYDKIFQMIFLVSVISVALWFLFLIIWKIWISGASESRSPVTHGNLSQFLSGSAAIIFGVGSIFVALNLWQLQNAQRNAAALDRIATTVQWWRTQHFAEQEALRKWLVPSWVTQDRDLYELALLDEYKCIIYLTKRIGKTKNWVDEKLHPEATTHLMEVEALGSPPGTDNYVKSLPPTDQKIVSDAYDDCTRHLYWNADKTPAGVERVGQAMQRLIYDVLDVPDIALAHWELLYKDSELKLAKNQLRNQAKSEFCPNGPDFKNDVYALFTTLRDTEQDKNNPANRFASSFLQSFPNLTPFLACVCQEDEHNAKNCPSP